MPKRNLDFRILFGYVLRRKEISSLGIVWAIYGGGQKVHRINRDFEGGYVVAIRKE